MTGRRFGSFGLKIGAALFLTWALAWGLGLRMNTSASVPVGLWRESALKGLVSRGQFVAVCPEDTEPFRLARARGYLTAGWCGKARNEVMFKPVTAVAGDVVTVGEAGIAVNGVSIEHTVALRVDAHGESLPVVDAGTYAVAKGTAWLISNTNDRSFDSRYFCAIEVTQIRGVITPLFVWGTPGSGD